MDEDEFKLALEAALYKYFPQIAIKEEQYLCIESLVFYRKDVLAVLPTGYGKSLIYQLLPKVLSEFWLQKTGEIKTSLVLVVSPLELIKKQQVERLNTNGIKAASLEDLNTCDNIGEIEVLFGSAEHWLSEKWRMNLKSGCLSRAEFLVVDEVHTVETWGTGKKGKVAFRQAFGQVKDLRSFLGEKPVLALTATADRAMRQRLCKCLGFRGHKEFLISPNKHNIRYTMAEADRNLTCLDWLVGILKSTKEESPFTIVFCHTVSDIVLVLSSLLTKLGNDAYIDGTDPASERCLLGVYYSATPESEKSRISESFNGKGMARVVIASTSLSMGVDFPHVKYVIHFGPGRTISDHLQQAGRAGRDSQQSFNIILHQGKHLSQCEASIRNVVRNDDCIRKLLMCHFTDKEVTVPIMHDCCNRCHKKCACTAEGQCSMPLYDFDGFEIGVPSDTTYITTRDVTDDDKQCLKEALHEVQLSLHVNSCVTLFDSSGLITHGFSDDVINDIVANSDKIFSINDLMEYGFISSLHLGVVVLEVLNEVFEDIVIDSSLYQLSVLSIPIIQYDPC